MKTIFPPYDILDMLLPTADSMPEAERLRRSVFVVEESVAEGKLLYNTLTNQMVLLDEGGNAQKELWHGMFIVDKDADERKTSRQILKLKQTVTTQPKGISSYVIFTTTDCNAHCFYCYEHGCYKRSMSIETAEKLVRYIIDHKVEGESVKLRWFGGEPLYNISVIDYIVDQLTEREVKFHSSMISNGYLFTKDIVKRAKEKWLLHDIQITLDGTEKVYNRIKAYHNPQTNPYQTVLENIRTLAENDIHVSIRLNIDMYNIDDIFALVNELSDTLPKKNVTVYSHMLFDNEGSKKRVREDAERERLFEKQIELTDLIEKYGFSNKKGLDNNFKATNCMADSPNSLTVLPDGYFGKCEHYSDDHFVGHVDREELDHEALLAHKELRPELPECENCPFYPTCIRIKVCPNQEVCYPEDRKEKLYDLRKRMVNQYNIYKEKHENKQ